MSKAIDLANAIADDNKDKFQHRWTVDNHASLTKKVDDVIGFWPVDAKYLIFAHSDERAMRFAPPGFIRNGWWTDVMTQNDYYAHKLGIENIKSYQQAIKNMETVAQLAKHAASLVRGIEWPDPAEASRG